jgi:hypothetical protein
MIGQMDHVDPKRKLSSEAEPRTQLSPESSMAKGISRRTVINSALAVGTVPAAALMHSSRAAGAAFELAGTEGPTESLSPAPSRGGAAGPWIRSTDILTPKHFGGISGTSSDSAAALNAFFQAAATDGSFNYCATGDWATGSALTIDPGNYGANSFELNFGNCRITALAVASRLLTIRDSNDCKFSGKVHLRGTNFGSDAHSRWTCDVALFCDNVGQSTFEQISAEGFGYAAIESNRGTGSASFNDSVHWGHINAKRIGSGDRHLSRSLSANWHGAANVGSYGAVGQYTQFTVDALPIAYVQPTTISPNLPDRPLYVEISGRLFTVIYVNTSTNTLRIFPWLAAAMGTGGTLRYHYGGALILRGGDSNIATWSQVSANGCSTGVEIACLYGPSGQTVKTQACGSNMRIGFNNGNVMWGGFVGIRYCESCNFNMVLVTRNAEQFYAGASPASSPPATDNDVDISIPLSAGDVYSGTGFGGITFGGNALEGWFYRRKYIVDKVGTQTLDFSLPATFDHPVFITQSGVDTAAFRLKAGTATTRQYFGLDCAQVTVIGRGNNGQLTGTITITPPAEHSINGGAASAPFIYAGNSFTGPANLRIYYDGVTSWTIKGNNMLSGMVTYDPPSLASGKSSSIESMMVTGAIIGDGVNMSFSNALAGARITGWVSATNTISYYFTNEAGANPLDLKSGTVRARIIR